MFLVSQNYLATDPNLPVSFTISGMTGGDVVDTPAKGADGSIELHHDLSTLAPGTYDLSATATNSAGTSAPSAVLAVVIPVPIGIPSAPVLGTSET